jgi:hypothetical protein
VLTHLRLYTVVGMFTVAAVVPSPPLLIAPLGGVVDPDVSELRVAVGRVVDGLGRSASSWIAVGVAEDSQVIGPDVVGTFRGFGGDVTVGLSPEAGGEPDPELPLPALLAAALRGAALPEGICEVRMVAADTTSGDAVGIGAELRARLAASPEPMGLLIVGDGAATLTEKSPGYFDPRAAAVQAELDRALRTGDRAALVALDPELCRELGIEGRAAFQVLAGAFPGLPRVSEQYCGAPFGVSYWAGTWRD